MTNKKECVVLDIIFVAPGDSKPYAAELTCENRTLYPFQMPHHADTKYRQWCKTDGRYRVPYSKLSRQRDGSPAVRSMVNGHPKNFAQYTALCRIGLPRQHHHVCKGRHH